MARKMSAAAPSLEDLLSGAHKRAAEDPVAGPGKNPTSGKPLEITEQEENVCVQMYNHVDT